MRRFLTAFGVAVAVLFLASPLLGSTSSRLCVPTVGCLIGDGTDLFIDEDDDNILDPTEPNLTINAPSAVGNEQIQGTLDVVGDATFLGPLTAQSLTSTSTSAGFLNLNEPSGVGSDFFKLTVPAGGLTASVTCEVGADGKIPSSCLSGVGGISGVTVIDVTGAANPCSLIQTEVAKFNNKTASPNLKITGTVNVQYVDFEDRGNYRSCVHVGSPTEGLTYSDGVHLNIDWTASRFIVDMTGQTEPAIFLQLGDKYDSGTTGMAETGNGTVSHWLLSMKGTMIVQSTVSVETGGWVDGRIPGLPLHTLANSSTFVGVMFSGIHSPSLSGWKAWLDGAARDSDDVGVVFQSSFASSSGQFEVTEFGTGILVSGPNDATVIPHHQFTQNNVGIAYGTYVNCDKMIYEDGTTDAEATRGTHFMGGDNEGNLMNNLVVFCGGPDFNEYYIEQGTQNGPSIIIGAGQCAAGSRAALACAVDAECPTSTCTGTGLTDALSNISFEQSELDASSNSSYPGTFHLGPGATDASSQNNLKGLWISSPMPTVTPPTSVNLVWNPLATMQIHVLAPAIEFFAWSDYPYVSHSYGNRTRRDKVGTPHTITQREMTAHDILTNTAAATNQTWTLPTPDISMVAETQFCDTGGAGELILDPDAATTISILPFGGITMAAGEAITSDVGTGISCVTLRPFSATSWAVMDWSGAWTNVAGAASSASFGGTTPTLLMAATGGGEGKIDMVESAGPETVMNFWVDTGTGTATHVMRLSGVTDRVELGQPGTSGLRVSTTDGAITMASTGTSLAIPADTASVVNAAGEVAIDTSATRGQLVYATPTVGVVDPRRTENWVIETPVDADHFKSIKLPYGITLISVDCIVVGGTSIDINIQECAATGGTCGNNQTAALTCDADGAATTTFGGAEGSAMDATDWLALDMAGAPSGSVTSLTVTLTYTIVRE